jgi:hypothetical protein
MYRRRIPDSLQPSATLWWPKTSHANSALRSLAGSSLTRLTRAVPCLMARRAAGRSLGRDCRKLAPPRATLAHSPATKQHSTVHSSITLTRNKFTLHLVWDLSSSLRSRTASWSSGLWRRTLQLLDIICLRNQYTIIQISRCTSNDTPHTTLSLIHHSHWMANRASKFYWISTLRNNYFKMHLQHRCSSTDWSDSTYRVLTGNTFPLPPRVRTGNYTRHADEKQ